MRRNTFLFAIALAVCVLYLGGAVKAQDAAKVAGSWDLSSQGRQGNVTQTLTLEQNGTKLTGTLKGQRGDSPLEGSVDGNKINFTVKVQTPNGEISIPYTGTVNGDSMQGTRKLRDNDVPWTAKRSSQ